ncbi:MULTISPECIES: GNAT family N-acetyltransferase [unclassified Microcella]|uniref:GNAT family N-acetyltransferase n=1 Tax=unclassified Microcella TaxID=2630066 RepID=UPI0006F74951|nr:MULTISPECIES: GNAT family N-acetyltransferase [unclassified Microcella]KQV24712.1 phosphinothricin acetyltransferase [Yonghaparkia sp. Root332]KRF31001.1 phosphinothricin acetyltransferase [Yonghaparkia sp. Soil809]
MLEEEYQPRRVLPPHLRKQPEPEAPFAYTIREATEADLPWVREIYNHYVANSTVTFDEKPWTLRALKTKFAKVRSLGHPFLVAESPAGVILGFAYVYPWKEKAAYRFTVENSIYLGPASTGKGLGRSLLGELLERSRAAGIKEVIAVIADRGAEASIALHESFGFRKTGEMARVGFKFERWLGIVMLQKSLKKR